MYILIWLLLGFIPSLLVLLSLTKENEVLLFHLFFLLVFTAMGPVGACGATLIWLIERGSNITIWDRTKK